MKTAWKKRDKQYKSSVNATLTPFLTQVKPKVEKGLKKIRVSDGQQIQTTMVEEQKKTSKVEQQNKTSKVEEQNKTSAS